MLKNNANVVSLGGGGFVNTNIRKEVLNNHFSIWLNWDAEVLLKRIKKSKKRPLAFNSTDQEMINLMKTRNKLYSKANLKINCNKLTKTEIVNKIIKIHEVS